MHSLQQSAWRLISLVALGAIGSLSSLWPAAVLAGACVCFGPQNVGTGSDCYHHDVNLKSEKDCQTIKQEKSDLKYELCTVTNDSLCRRVDAYRRVRLYQTEFINCGPEKQSLCEISARACKQESDCPPNGGTATCFQGACYFDATARAAFDASVAGLPLTSIERELKIIKPYFSIHIPGLQFSDPKNSLDKEGNIYIPFLGEFLAVAYRFAIAVASIVGAVIIMKNAVDLIWFGSTGEGKQQAYKRIGQVAIGLMILWTSYALLYRLNPDLVQFKALKVRYIERRELPEENDSVAAEDFPPDIPPPSWKSGEFNCDQKTNYPPSGVVSPSQLVSEECPGIEGRFTVIRAMHRPLCKVGLLAQKNKIKLRVNSSFRDFKGQRDLWCGKCATEHSDIKERQQFCATPGYSNHGHGRAVDMVMIDDAGQQLFSVKSSKQCQVREDLIAQLASLFYDADPLFVRLETEIWHFEFGTKGQKRREQTRTYPKLCTKAGASP